VDCAPLSPFAIDALNFGLNFSTYLPAIATGLMTFGYLDNKIEKKYPGERNRNLRTFKSGGALLAGMAVFFTVWSAGLVLTKDFRCAFP